MRAERGVLQNQLRSVTEAAGRGSMAPQIDTLLRNMEGRETTVRYKQLLETSNLLLSAAPERFKDVGAMDTMLGQLADVSRDPQAFSMVSQAFTRNAGGRENRPATPKRNVGRHRFCVQKSYGRCAQGHARATVGVQLEKLHFTDRRESFPLLNPGGVDACVADQVVRFAGPS